MTRFCDNLYGILARAGKEDEVQEVIKCITEKINLTPPNEIPRSISLLQYFLAILVEAGIIILPLDKYYSDRKSFVNYLRVRASSNSIECWFKNTKFV